MAVARSGLRASSFVTTLTAGLESELLVIIIVIKSVIIIVIIIFSRIKPAFAVGKA